MPSPCPSWPASAASPSGIPPTITLPDARAALWPGCGGRVATTTRAARMVHLRWEFTTAAFDWLTRTDGRTSDRAAAAAAACLPGAVRLADLGYFSLTVLPLLIAQRVHLLCRFPDHPLVICADAPGVVVGGCPLGSMFATERGSGWIGRSPSARPPAFPVACWRCASLRRALAAWDGWLTTLPPERLTLDAVRVLIGLRRLIERVFKAGKSGGRVDASCSQQPDRVLTEVYAKLVAMLVQQWCILVCGGDGAPTCLRPSARLSLVGAPGGRGAHDPPLPINCLPFLPYHA